MEMGECWNGDGEMRIEMGECGNGDGGKGDGNKDGGMGLGMGLGMGQCWAVGPSAQLCPLHWGWRFHGPKFARGGCAKGGCERAHKCACKTTCKWECTKQHANGRARHTASVPPAPAGGAPEGHGAARGARRGTRLRGTRACTRGRGRPGDPQSPPPGCCPGPPRVHRGLGERARHRGGGGGGAGTGPGMGRERRGWRRGRRRRGAGMSSAGDKAEPGVGRRARMAAGMEKGPEREGAGPGEGRQRERQRQRQQERAGGGREPPGSQRGEPGSLPHRPPPAQGPHSPALRGDARDALHRDALRCTGMRCAAAPAGLRLLPFPSFPFPPAPMSVPPRSPPPPPQPRPRPPFLPLRRHRETTWAPGGRQRPPPGPRRYRPDPSPSVRPSGSAPGRPRRRPPSGAAPHAARWERSRGSPSGRGRGGGGPLHRCPHGAVGPRAEPSRSRARWGRGEHFIP